MKRKLQINSFIYNTCLCGSSYKDIFPYCVVKCLETMIASEQDSWNNCTNAHISLKLHKLTGWFIVLCMNVVQLLKHFWNYCLSSFYAFYHFPWERVGCWFYTLKTTLNKLILLIGYTFNHLASMSKSALIQKPSA